MPAKPHKIIVQDALAQLARNLPDLQAEFEPPTAPDDPVDGYLYLRRPRLGALEPLAVEIKPGVTPATLPKIINEFNQLQKPAVLVTEYVTPGVAKLLKNKGVFYLDVAGNAYLDTGRLYVMIGGQKAVEMPRRMPMAVLGDAGVRLIFALLAVPDLLARPYREIAGAAGVAQGTITHVLRGLVQLGFYQVVGTRRLLRNRLELAERWAEAYAERLRHKLIQGRFRAPGPEWWKEADFTGDGALWGGEPAGALLTRHLRPQTFTVYLMGAGDEPARRGRLIARLGLRKDPEGEVELLEGFWNPELVLPTETGTVHPLIAYADLMAMQDARCLETGRIIHDEHLAPTFRN